MANPKTVPGKWFGQVDKSGESIQPTYGKRHRASSMHNRYLPRHATLETL